MENNYQYGGFQQDPDQEGPHRTYEYYQVNQNPAGSPPPVEPYSHKRPKKTKRQKNSMAGKFGITITLALVFGLVAGLVFQGVNLVSSRLIKEPETKNATVGTVQMESDKTAGVPAAETADGSETAVTNTSAGVYSVADIARNAMPSIVAITAISVQEVQSFFGGTQQYEGVGSGSGIIIGQNDDELLIATNNHVVEDAKNVSVSFYGDEIDATVLENSNARTSEELAEEYAKNSVAAQIKGTDAENDLAVIAVNKSDIPDETMSQIKVATMGDSEALVVGEQVVAIGNALGYGQSVTSGYVSALDRTIETRDSSDSSDGLIQTDAAINAGNSGGALLNMRGEVIGINSAKFAGDGVEGMGFAIPVATAQPILGDLMTRQTRSKVSEDQAAYLGISCKEVSAEVSQIYMIPTGVFVATVEENGPAQKAGVLPGDVLTKIDGTKVTTYTELTNQLQYYAAGETIEIVVKRADGGEYVEHTLTITLGSRKDVNK